MKISIDNYEQYVLDFLEGNLLPQQEALFKKFLAQNPEIKAEIEGVDQYVLIPDTGIHYPDKTLLYRSGNSTVVPFWNTYRIAAAAAVLLLVSAATFFIWQSSYNDPFLVTVEPPAGTDTNKNGEQEVLARTALPETLSELKKSTEAGSLEELEEGTKTGEPGIRGLGEKQPTPRINVQFHDPALTSGVVPDRHDDATRQTTVNKLNESPDPVQIPNGSELSYGIDFQDVVPPLSPRSAISGLDSLFLPVPIPNSSDVIGTEIAVFDAEGLYSKEEKENTVAYLPEKQLRVSPTKEFSGYYSHSGLPKTATQSFKIHIPSEFLSETWGDISLAKFKNNLLPEFIKTN